MQHGMEQEIFRRLDARDGTRNFPQARRARSHVFVKSLPTKLISVKPPETKIWIPACVGNWNMLKHADEPSDSG